MDSQGVARVGKITGYRLRFLHGKDPSDSPGVSYPLVCHLLDTLLVSDLLWTSRVRAGLRDRLAGAATVGGERLGESRSHALLLYAAGLHDLGKANPFFQYQERLAPAPWVEGLRGSLDLPPTPTQIGAFLRSDPGHALRRHEFLSHRSLSGGWAKDSLRLSDDAAEAVIVGGHHGYWRSMRQSEAAFGDHLMAGGWQDAQRSLSQLVEETVISTTGVRREDIPRLAAPDAALVTVCLSGIVIQADWIASDDAQVSAGKRLFASGLDPHLDPGAWMEARRPVLAEHVDASLGTDRSGDRAGLPAAIMGGYEPRPLQRQAATLETPDVGLWIVMYPTGDGKTEAAGLRHALDSTEGLIFGLPTRATTDAMEARVAEWFNVIGDSVVKSHQFAELGERIPLDSDDEGAGCGNAYWYTTALRKLAAPNVVATCDQVLAGALRQKHVAMRLFNLANHHVVLDEVHTYDAYQTELLVELLHWWGATATRVTLLSATLPRDHMTRMVEAYRRGAGGPRDEPVPDTTFPGSLYVPADPASPMSALPPGDGATRTLPPVVIELATSDDREARVESHIDWVRATAIAHPDSPIAVVSNTVADCIAIASRLAAEPAVTATHDVACLHSSMVVAHRRACESGLLSAIGKPAHCRGFDHTRPGLRPMIVVGTQVIQASLDIDVDFLASDLAPAPDLIQRLGRQWRFLEDANDVPEERIARTGAQVRVARVVAVTGDAGVSFHGAIPYLQSTLQNTYTWLRQRSPGPLDVIAESQAWVDASYDRWLASGIGETELVANLGPIARDRAAQDAKEIAAALQSKARIATHGGRGSIGLLRSIGGGATWRDLVELTAFNTDEALMRTRFIEEETASVLLFDSSGLTGTLGVDENGREVRLPVLVPDIETLSPRDAARLLDFSVGVPRPVAVEIEQAARLTLDKPASWTAFDWSPDARILAATLPVDIKHLTKATYSALTGLTPVKDPA